MHTRNIFNSLVIICCLLAINLGCVKTRKFMGGYKSKPFDAQGWRNGSAAERGRMSWYLIGVSPLRENGGNDRREIIATLGEPDQIRTDRIGERPTTVLMYEIDTGDEMFVGALQIHLENEDRPLFANYGVMRER
jgi:hypothetical protein